MSSHKKNNRIRVNQYIRAEKVRLIGATGEQLGVVTVPEAQLKAQENGLDLVEVAPEAQPPVCKILDFGKYLYDLKKKDKESKKKQKNIDIKEVKMSSKIEEHDYQTKLRNGRRFIERGDKIKLTMFFRGREITHADLGLRVINRYIEDISDITDVERNDGLEGNSIHVYLMPKANMKKRTTKSSGKDASNAKAKDKQSSKKTV